MRVEEELTAIDVDEEGEVALRGGSVEVVPEDL
jgi:hypothetical protein